MKQISITTLLMLLLFLPNDTTFAGEPHDAADRFRKLDNNLILDAVTGHFWYVPDEKGDYATALALADEFNKIQALAEEPSLPTWRLPSVQELQQIHLPGGTLENHTFLPEPFAVHDVWCWAAAEDGDGYGAFNFIRGDAVWVAKDFPAQILLIAPKKQAAPEVSEEEFAENIAQTLKNATTLRADGEYLKAVELYSEVLRKDLLHPEANRELEATLKLFQLNLEMDYLKGNYEEAKKRIESLIVMQPNHPLTQLAIYSFNRQIDVREQKPHISTRLRTSDGRIIDLISGLEWRVSDKAINKLDAVSWLDGLNGTQGKWRLPTPAEVEGLVIETGYGNQLDHIFGQLIDFTWVQRSDQDAHHLIYRFADGGLIGSSSATDSSYFSLIVRMSQWQQPEVVVAEKDTAIIGAEHGLTWEPGPAKAMSWIETNRWLTELRKTDTRYRLPLTSELFALFTEKNRVVIPAKLAFLKGKKVWTGETSGLEAAFLFDLAEGGLSSAYQAADAGFPIAVKGDYGRPNQQEGQRFSHDSSGIITDWKHNKQWKLGPRQGISREDAIRWLASQSSAFGGGWRLPTVEEIKSIQKDPEPTHSRYGIVDVYRDFMDPEEIFFARGLYVWVVDGTVAQSDINVVSNASLSQWPTSFNGKYDWDDLRVFVVRDIGHQSSTAPKVLGKRYLRDKQGVIFDMKTGYRWRIGPERDMNWFEAYEWVESLNRFHSPNWQLPSLLQLADIDCQTVSGEEREETERLFGGEDRSVWSGDDKRDDAAWTFYYRIGDGNRHAERTFNKDMRVLAVSVPPVGEKQVTQDLSSRLDSAGSSHINSIGMSFVRIAPGTFTAGDDKNTFLDGITTAGPDHEVTLSKPFQMQQTEVTIGQFLSYLNATGEEGGTDLESAKCPVEKYQQGYRMKLGSGGTWGSLEQPMVCVSWEAANSFTAWLSKKEEKWYRLPTEAEWEYAGRAGSSAPFFFGDDWSLMPRYGWYWSNSDQRTHPVALKPHNGWGLFDIHGNVEEWMFDERRVYTEQPVVDPLGGTQSQMRGVRGGDYTDGGSRVSFTIRGAMASIHAMSPKRGFRVVLE